MKLKLFIASVAGKFYFPAVKKAVELDNTQALEKALSKFNHPPTLTHLLNKPDIAQEVLLAKVKSVKAAQLLVEAGAKPNYVANIITFTGHLDQRSLLDYHMKNLELLEFLIKSGAPIFKPNDRLSYLDSVAPVIEDFVRDRHVKALDAWLTKNKLVNPKLEEHKESHTVLSMAIQSEQTEIIKLVIQKIESFPGFPTNYKLPPIIKLCLTSHPEKTIPAVLEATTHGALFSHYKEEFEKYEKECIKGNRLIEGLSKYQNYLDMIAIKKENFNLLSQVQMPDKEKRKEAAKPLKI